MSCAVALHVPRWGRAQQEGASPLRRTHDRSPFHISSRWHRPLRNCRRASSLKAQSEVLPQESTLNGDDSSVEVQGSVVLLFKHDLRLDDHPGLHLAAESGASVVTFYCLDPSLLHPYLSIPGGVELLWGALKSMKTAYQSIGSDFVVRIGPFADTLSNFMSEIGSQKLLTESEFDAKWREKLEGFKKNSPEITVEEWTCRLRNPEDYRQNFREIEQNAAIMDPLPPLHKLQPLADELDAGELLDFESFKQLLLESRERVFQNGREAVDPFQRSPVDLWEQWSSILTSDPHSPLHYLTQYLSLHQESNVQGNEVLERLVELTEDPSFPGISFSSIFALALFLGVISSRRVYHEVRKRGSMMQKDPLHKAALLTSQSFDFHGHLAQGILENGCSGTPGTSSKEFWRWQGILAEYSVARPFGQPSKGSAVMVHGFGASCMHWRRNVDALTSAGYVVYCPSLPGYGRTQKLYMKYCQILWTEFLSAFITEVVQAPVLLAGNSIGAFVAANTAADHPEIVSGLVLINPAGPLVENYTPSGTSEEVLRWTPPEFVVDALSRLLLFYLEKSAGRILKSVYPVCQENADEEFLQEILRASFDPNAIAVVKSVFFLKKPEPLNYLLSEKYRGPVLLLQGALDPLNNAVQRAERMEKLCPHVDVKMINAGHCGHDETPDAVNQHLLSFVENLHKLTFSV